MDDANNIFLGLKLFFNWIMLWLLIAIAFQWLYSISPIGRDDSDEQGWFGKRSGVSIVVDKKTGIEYLKTDTGGITPRLNNTKKD